MANPDDYTVGWICAIHPEYIAARAFLDERHENPEHLSDIYALGKIGKHNVAISVLPMGEYGTASAARVAEGMQHIFPNIRIGLMVGIGGGVPSQKHDIRLGDIVVSIPGNGEGGVIQYDFGKTIQGQTFQQTSHLNQPPTTLREAVAGARARYTEDGHQLEDMINDIFKKKPRLRKDYTRPDPASDRLYLNHIVHPPEGESNCAVSCGDEPPNLILRPKRTEDEDNPQIHYGLIASGNQLMKDALVRDKLATEKDVLCFEMEAAGLVNHFPCLVIRGICDYSDSHKNKEWQGYAAMVAAAYTKDLLYHIPPQMVEAEERIKVIFSIECQAILDWLAPNTYATQQTDFIGRRQEGTGEWLLNADEFKNWISQNKQTLFCPGIPGAGKTIVTSIVVDYVDRKFRTSGSGIAYLYCNFRLQNEQRPTDLLMSLLRQFARPDVPETVRSLYRDYRARETRPTFNEILGVLHSVVAGYPRAFIIIDALDECQVSGGVRSQFMSAIFSLQSKTQVNIFATSRPIPDIEREFQRIDAVSLEIRASDEDMGRYIDGHIWRLPSFVQQCPDRIDQAKAAIIKAAKGMFLLAILHLDFLESKTNLMRMEQALPKLPEGLDESYEEAMERIQNQKRDFSDLAIQTLSWITFAKRPLTGFELQHALAVMENTSALDEHNITDIELIISVCAGLVTIDKESGIIRLVHYTTQEYLERTQMNSLPNAHTDITKTCVTYLSFEVFETGYSLSKDALIKRFKSNILFQYAAQNWGYHSSKSSIEGQKLIVDLLQSTAKVSACSQVMEYRQYRLMFTATTKMTGLHLAAYFGLEKSTSALLERNASTESKDLFSLTPLALAAMNGHELVLNLLIENNANIESKDHFSRTPLALAAINGHESVVNLLIERNANIESKDYSNQTPLSLTAENGHEPVMKLLLERNANIESKDDHDQTPLSWAARMSHEPVMKLLLERNANIESKDYQGQTPLSWAAEKGHEPVMKLLLERNVNIESRDDCGRTSLSWAAEKGHEPVMKLLLERNVNIESRDDCGRTSLSWAAEKGHEPVMKLLLERNVNIESRDDCGRTSLSWAAEKGHEPVMKLLLERNVNIESRDDCGRTSLSWAAEKGHEPVMKLLLERNADIESKNRIGKTPLSLAASHGHESVVKLLLERNADIESKDDYDQTPLSWAAWKGHESVMKLLLERNVNIESRDDCGRTSLSWAAEKGHEPVMKLLLERNADIEIGKTPLSLAASHGHESVVKLLLERNADIESKNRIGKTPLSLAASHGHESVVKLLLERNADIESKDAHGQTPLSLAAAAGHEPVVKLLLEREAAIHRTRNRHSLQAATSPTQAYSRGGRLRPDPAPMDGGEWL
ncbi:hypothetical protein EMPG_11549 [Blastomyces silverae]|uniref:Uncharacterized protein n=1 Tax=Blastomyces silverae TaxID=2060906 RepID=A0A0H1BQA7_9EURO|nr:hypothetical protein EMPG_11549 [Blastomyces silverae]